GTDRGGLSSWPGRGPCAWRTLRRQPFPSPRFSPRCERADLGGPGLRYSCCIHQTMKPHAAREAFIIGHRWITVEIIQRDAFDTVEAAGAIAIVTEEDRLVKHDVLGERGVALRRFGDVPREQHSRPKTHTGSNGARQERVLDPGALRSFK